MRRWPTSGGPPRRARWRSDAGADPGCTCATISSSSSRSIAPAVPSPAATRSDLVYVTGLSNPTLPLIRFELTDQITVLDGPCPCGSAHRLIADVEGRLDDLFAYDRGVLVLSSRLPLRARARGRRGGVRDRRRGVPTWRPSRSARSRGHLAVSRRAGASRGPGAVRDVRVVSAWSARRRGIGASPALLACASPRRSDRALCRPSSPVLIATGSRPPPRAMDRPSAIASRDGAPASNRGAAGGLHEHRCSEVPAVPSPQRWGLGVDFPSDSRAVSGCTVSVTSTDLPPPPLRDWHQQRAPVGRGERL